MSPRQVARNAGVTANDVMVMLASELATVPPLPEAVAADPGSMPKAARGDHVHKRLGSVAAQPEQVLNAQGEYTITFTREFLAATPPTVICSEVEGADLPSVTFKTLSYILKPGDSSLIIGCVIKGKRRRALPSIGQLSTGLTLLLNLITALNTILLSLNQFLPEVNAVAARFSYVAFASSQPVPTP